MIFAERYAKSLHANSLQDDEHHFAVEALAASAHADRACSRGSLGSLLARVKYANGLPTKEFEAGSGNLASLLRIWLSVVTEKGKARQWVKIKAEWDVAAAHGLYKRVADESLAHWLDSRCQSCNGAAQTEDRRICSACNGTGRKEVAPGYVGDRVRDMVSELEELSSEHAQRAIEKLRKTA